MKELIKQLSKVNKAESKYNNEESTLCRMLQKKTDFEIYVTNHASDGVCLMSEQDAVGMRADIAIEVIKQHGRLTDELFEKFSTC